MRKQKRQETAQKHPKVDILNDWALVESDFQREYNMDLTKTLSTMTWRRFCVLLNGLSTNAVFVLTGKARSEGNAPIEDDALAERAMDQLFK